jgi:predicted dehydrogenase
VKIAILGLGSAGRRHALNARELGHHVIAFDPLVEHVPNITRASSVDEAVAEADAVVIASPSSLHAEQAVLALSCDRHTLVEKPLAVTAREAAPVVEAAAQTKAICGVAMNLRFHRGVLALQKLLVEQELGSPRYVQASFGYDLRLWRPEKDYRESYSAQAALGGGILLDAVHELDYLTWLLGPVESVTAELGRVSELEIDVEDTALLILRFASGVLGAVDLNYIDPAYRRGCIIVGSEAVASWDWNASTIAVSRAKSVHKLDVAENVADTYRAVLKDFVAAAESTRDPRTPVEDGVAALRIVDASRRSASRGQRVSVS